MHQTDIFCVMLKRNQDFVIESTKDLSHSDSVLQLPGDSNCMNWILGHVAVYRDIMLSLILETRCMSTSEIKLYENGSTPINSTNKSVRLEQLLKFLQQSFERLMAWLESNPDGLTALSDKTSDLHSDYGSTAVEMFEFLSWHETNHIGELHALRELALVYRGKGWK